MGLAASATSTPFVRNGSSTSADPPERILAIRRSTLPGIIKLHLSHVRCRSSGGKISITTHF